MTIKLNTEAFERAESMIKRGVEIEHISNNWDEVKPDVNDELEYLESHTLKEYGLWFLGIDTNAPTDKRSKFVYPYGDFDVLQKSALIFAEEQAKKNHHNEIAEAAHKLLTKINHSKK